jgi:hypothetical protein
MKFLEMIQYNVYVKDSLYTKYYLELKSLVHEDVPVKPMDLFTMNKMEANPIVEYNYKKVSKTSGEIKEYGKMSNVIIN